MYYSVELFSKTFANKISKKAYMNACKWVAINIISKQVELGNSVSWNIEKISKFDQLPTFKLTVFVSVSKKELEEKHCNICREAHNLFYLNSCKTQCTDCKLNAFFRRCDDTISSKKKYVKEKIGDIE